MKQKKKNKLHFLCAGTSSGRLPKAEIEGLLISTASDCKNPKSIQRTKDMIGAAKPKHLMIDSGGFQLLEASATSIS